MVEPSEGSALNIRAVSFWAVVLDQASKYLIMRSFKLGESVTLIKDILYFTYVQNPGAAFGFMAGTGAAFRIPFFIAITVGAGLVVYSFQRFVHPDKKWLRTALGLVWGGAMGNFIDRIIHGKVVDFIDAGHINFPFGFHFTYIFNGADSCITIGIIMLIWSFLFEKWNEPGMGK